MAAKRYITSKEIDLTELLPSNYKGTEVESFLEMFQGQLNALYEGTSFELSGSLTSDDNLLPPTTASTSAISILEKINRLAELHDPDTIDLKYIQFFANNLGYNINLNRDDLLNPDAQEEQLRFMVRNLPYWYKIKSTKNAIRIFLFSYGLIADIYNWFTTDYNNTWITSLSSAPNTHYNTPHFSIRIDLDATQAAATTDLTHLDSIVRAINSIKPINTVFHGFHLWARRILNDYARMRTKTSLVIRIPYVAPPEASEYIFSDNFDNDDELWVNWYPFNEDEYYYSFADSYPGYLALAGAGSNLWEPPSPPINVFVLGELIALSEFTTIETKIELVPGETASAGIFIAKEIDDLPLQIVSPNSQFVSFLSIYDGSRKVSLGEFEWDMEPLHSEQTAAFTENTFYLRLVKDGTTFNGYTSTDGDSWNLALTTTFSFWGTPNLCGLYTENGNTTQTIKFYYFTVR